MKPFRVVVVLALAAAGPLLGQFTQQGPKLIGSGSRGGLGVGTAVAISVDGTTAVVGANGDRGGMGAAFVFVKSGGAWVQQGGKLVGTGAVGYANQGCAVAISADGNTVIVGGSYDNSSAGAAWVFVRSSGVWTQEGSKLVGTGAVSSNVMQGVSVALSSNGDTALVGGSGDSSGAGAGWVFTRSSGNWSQQQKLVASDTVLTARVGISAALSADGNTALLGGDQDNFLAGAGFVFTRSGTVWTEQAKLVGTGATGSAQQGRSVSLSSDGNTALSGSTQDSGGIGAAWAFRRTGGVWSQLGSKLVGTGNAGASRQGYSLSLSGDANTAVVGGYSDATNTGAAWVFTWNGSAFTQLGSKLVGTGATGTARQGWAVSVSGTGGTIFVGGQSDDGVIGAVWVFAMSLGAYSQQGSKLGVSGAEFESYQGSAVALSSNGSTAVVGGAADDGSLGATWVYTRSAGAFSQQGTKLVGSGAVGAPQQGTSVGISADGNTMVVGGMYDNSSAGAAWVFTRSGGAWTPLGGKLVGTGGVGTPRQGSSAAMAGDGNTFIIGAPNDNSNVGAAWVFARSGGVFVQEGGKLVGTGAVGAGRQGTSVAISADGNTAAVGGLYDNTNPGAIWVFTRTGGVWTQQGSKLVATGVSGIGNFGSAVALSADGNTLLGGGSGDGVTGAAWVFTRTGGVWTQQGTKLIGTGAVGNARQGSVVALSSDGNTAIVGGWQDDADQGAAWVFTRTGGVWTQQGTKLAGTGAVGAARQGFSVALSGDGRTALLGGYMDNLGVGAAWPFAVLPTAVVSGSRGICPGASALIQADVTGIAPWSVTWSDGFVQSGAASSPITRTVSPAVTTTYTITSVSDAVGSGSSSGSAIVTIMPVPAAPGAGSNSPVCMGADLNLTATTVGSGIYSWTGPNGFASSSQNPTIASTTLEAAGTYSVTVDVGGCVSPAGTTVVVIDPDFGQPVVTPPDPVTVDQTACCGSAGGATSSQSGTLFTFLAGGTATDDCDTGPTRLTPQIAGVNVTGATCFEPGTTTVTFRFQDSSTKIGWADSQVTVRMFGDLNLDAVVDTSDMVVLRAYFNFAVSPGTPPFFAPLSSADLTHDASVDPSDLVVLRAYFNFAVGCLAP